MGEAEGRVNLDLLMNHLTKPCTSGPEELCLSNLAHEMVMGLVTPLPDRENEVVSSPLGHSKEADREAVCWTPQGGTFDPFAAGPEELMFAPKKKMLKKTCPPIQRQLNFVSCDLKEGSVDNILEETLEEESFVETTNRSFLDSIIPPRMTVSEKFVISDTSDTERKCVVKNEHAGCRKDMHLCESYSSKVGISGVDDIYFSKAVNDTDLGPRMPFPERKNPQVSSPSGQSDEADLGSNCRAPREGTFEPFAPSPEGLLMFARKKKLPNGTHVPVQRRLNFDFCCDSEENLVENVSEEASEEEIFLATLYRSLLDDVISHQIGESISESSLADSAPFNGLKTPTSLPLLKGIAGTCPGAPVRPTSKSRKFSVNICRKLEF